MLLLNALKFYKHIFEITYYLLYLFSGWVLLHSGSWSGHQPSFPWPTFRSWRTLAAKIQSQCSISYQVINVTVLLLFYLPLKKFPSSVKNYIYKYSGNLDTELVWYLNGGKLSDPRMVHYSNAICIPIYHLNTGHLNTGQEEICYSNVGCSDPHCN